MSYKQGLLTGIFHYPNKEQVSPDINPDPQYHFYPLGHQDTYHTHQEFHLHHGHKLEHPEDKLNKSLTGQFSHFSKAGDFYILRNRLNFFSFLDHHHIPLKVRILFVHFSRARNIFAHLLDMFYMFHQGLLSHFSTFFRRLGHPEDKFYKFLLDLLFRFNKVFGKQGYLEDNFHRFHQGLLSHFHKLKYTLRHPEDNLNNSLQDQFSYLNMHFFTHKHLKLHLH